MNEPGDFADLYSALFRGEHDPGVYTFEFTPSTEPPVAPTSGFTPADGLVLSGSAEAMARLFDAGD